MEYFIVLIILLVVFSNIVLSISNRNKTNEMNTLRQEKEDMREEIDAMKEKFDSLNADFVKIKDREKKFKWSFLKIFFMTIGIALEFITGFSGTGFSFGVLALFFNSIFFE